MRTKSRPLLRHSNAPPSRSRRPRTAPRSCPSCTSRSLYQPSSASLRMSVARQPALRAKRVERERALGALQLLHPQLHPRELFLVADCKDVFLRVGAGNNNIYSQLLRKAWHEARRYCQALGANR